MGKYLKMADVFGGEVTANHGDDNNGWSTVDTSLGLSIDESGDGGFKAKTADYVAHAINSHDELVAEVERLRGIVLRCSSALYIANKFCEIHTADECDDSIAIPISDALKEASKEVT